MPNIYVTDETKEILERASKADMRTQDGEIQFLCRQRLKELDLREMTTPSVGKDEFTKGAVKPKCFSIESMSGLPKGQRTTPGHRFQNQQGGSNPVGGEKEQANSS